MAQAQVKTRSETKSWFSLAELAGLNLPGLSRVVRVVARLAAVQRWSARYTPTGEPLFRQRPGRGGGQEYHVSLLPSEAFLELVRLGLTGPLANDSAGDGAGPDVDTSVPALVVTPAEAIPESLWAWFDAQPETTKAKARKRLEAVQAIKALEAANHTTTHAVAMISSRHKVSTGTLWNWLRAVAGQPVTDWLPKLAPRFKGGGVEAEIHPALWRAFKSDFLRPEEPGYAECHRRVSALGSLRGLLLPDVVTFRRRLEREVPPEVILAARKGFKAAMESLPPQRRSVAGLAALDAINIDGHRWDLRVRFPATLGQPESIQRPHMVMMQDIFSRKILSWRIGRSENAYLTQLCFRDLFEKWGIPGRCLMDNGRAFASKMVSGGAKSRYRFKILDAEPTGLLTGLGIQIHWATPGHGQAKPIERSFQDLEEIVSRHPACHGAYMGNHIDNKPCNWGEKSIDLDVFQELVNRGIAAYNARLGRNTEMTQGGSFDQTFQASYEARAIRWAPEEVRRLALMGADKVRCQRRSGCIELFDNRYWSESLMSVAGQSVTVRFDPDNLHSPLHVWRQTGEYLCQAPVIDDAGFFDLDAARSQAKLKSDYKKALRRSLEIEQLLSAQDLAKLYLPSADDLPLPLPSSSFGATQPQLVKLISFQGHTVGDVRSGQDGRDQDAQDAANDAGFTEDFGAAVAAFTTPSEPSEELDFTDFAFLSEDASPDE